MQESNTGTPTQVWRPGLFTEKYQAAGLASTREVAKEANLSVAVIEAVEKGSRTISEREAKQIAPLIDMDPVAFRLCHNAYATGQQLHIGSIALYDAYADHGSMEKLFEESKDGMRTIDRDICGNTLTVFEDLLKRDILTRKETRSFWVDSPQPVATWLDETTLLTTEAPSSAMSVAG